MGRSALIAALLVVALGLWMLSGQLGSKEQAPETDTTAEETKATAVMKVQTELVRAESITREITVQGELEPAQRLFHYAQRPAATSNAYGTKKVSEL